MVEDDSLNRKLAGSGSIGGEQCTGRREIGEGEDRMRERREKKKKKEREREREREKEKIWVCLGFRNLNLYHFLDFRIEISFLGNFDRVFDFNK